MILRRFCLFSLLISTALLIFAGCARQPLTAQAVEDARPRAMTADYTKDILPILEKRCHGCHKGEKPSGGLDLKGIESADYFKTNPVTTAKLIENIQTKRMPPVYMPSPTDSERALIVAWLEKQK
jgi:uncharacterized membrane protein